MSSLALSQHRSHSQGRLKCTRRQQKRLQSTWAENTNTAVTSVFQSKIWRKWAFLNLRIHRPTPQDHKSDGEAGDPYLKTLYSLVWGLKPIRPLPPCQHRAIPWSCFVSLRTRPSTSKTKSTTSRHYTRPRDASTCSSKTSGRQYRTIWRSSKIQLMLYPNTNHSCNSTVVVHTWML